MFSFSLLSFSAAIVCVLVCAVQSAVLRSRSALPKLHPTRDTEIVPYLQTELSLCSEAQQNIQSFLKTKGVEIGVNLILNRRSMKRLNGVGSRIVISTDENNVECRISLGKAPTGSKCIAPCGCSGSQKWVQFSEFNRLRRKDPSQWETCKTCQQRFETEAFSAFGGVKANLIGYLLDNRNLLRGAGGAVIALLLYIFSAPMLVSRVLTSRVLWQSVSYDDLLILPNVMGNLFFLSLYIQYPNWSKLTKLPLPLKLWAGKLAGQALASRYLSWEKNVLVQYLADWETQLIEENLPTDVTDEVKADFAVAEHEK